MLLSLPLLSFLLPQEGVPTRLPVPEKARVAVVEREIRELFKEEYASRDPEVKRSLAGRLYQESLGTKDDDQRYTLLCEARDLGAQYQDFESARRAIGDLCTRYEGSLDRHGTPAFIAARKGARSREPAVEAARFCLALAEDREGAGDFEGALAAAKEAQKFARTGRDKEVSDRAGRAVREIPLRQKRHEEAARAELALSVNPDDAEAAAIAGRYACLEKGAWERGLPLLAKADGPLGKLAAMELAPPGTPEARFEVGREWYERGQKDRDGWKVPMLERALYWLEPLERTGPGLLKLRVEKLVRKIHAEVPTKSVNLLRLIDIEKDCVAGEWKFTREGIACAPATFARIRLPYAPPAEYDFRIVFVKQSGSEAVGQMLWAADRDFAWELGGWRNTVHGFLLVEGLLSNRNPTGVRASVEDGRRYESVVRVRRTGVSAYLDGKLISKWEGGFEALSSATFWSVGKGALGVGANSCHAVFEKIEVVEVTGRGKLLR